MPDEPYVDPQDLQFGKSAAEKEEVLDRALKAGKSVEQLDDEPEDVRPGSKAEPAADDR